MSWDPDVQPDPRTWLALDEGQRASVIEAWHHDNPRPALHPPHLRGRNLSLHASLHAIIETQIASGEPAITGETVARLMEAGLRRHAALHAVMTELAREMDAARREGGYRPERFEQALRAIRPEDAIPLAGLGWMDAEEEPAPRNRAERRKQGRADRRKR